MSDQGAGGGIESGQMPAHARTKSENEPIPETNVETRPSAPEGESQEKLANPLDDSSLQELARSFEDRSTSMSTPVPPMSRNPSNCSQHHTTGARPPTYDGRKLSHHYCLTKPPEPPVTKATLSELDVSKIIHNPKLRHDINFDPELHFRPNLDGEKGKRKTEKANQFWESLLKQLQRFVVDREGFYRNFGRGDDWCLPQLLKAVKEIIQTLVPQRDREFLNEGLNVELLMQQFNRGIADLEKLASWLSGVLKLHCAPMRDDWVDEMYNELSKGNRENDMEELVKGMRSLLSVLEAMKLDVANHQIRCLRPVLIEDTVHFEQRFFVKKIQAKKLSVGGATEWYRTAEREYQSELARCGGVSPHAQAFGETAVFFEALTKLVMPSTSIDHALPNTFMFDDERIVKLRADMLDAINVEVCMQLYEELEKLSRILHGSGLAGLPFSQPSIPAYVEDETVLGNTCSPDFDFNALPSRPSSFVYSGSGSATSSPRNSGCLISQPQPAVDFAESRSKARRLYNSLLALLQTAPSNCKPCHRWEELISPVAIQIFRFVNVPQDILPTFEDKIARNICDVKGGELFSRVEEQFQARLLAELARRVREFRNLSGVGLFSLATGGRIHGPGRTWEASRGREQLQQHQQHQRDGNDAPTGTAGAREPRDDAGIEEMATRIAHLGILHWRVWGQLAYLGDIQSEFDNAMDISPGI